MMWSIFNLRMYITVTCEDYLEFFVLHMISYAKQKNEQKRTKKDDTINARRPEWSPLTPHTKIPPTEANG